MCLIVCVCFSELQTKNNNDKKCHTAISPKVNCCFKAKLFSKERIIHDRKCPPHLLKTCSCQIYVKGQLCLQSQPHPDPDTWPQSDTVQRERVHHG